MREQIKGNHYPFKGDNFVKCVLFNFEKGSTLKEKKTVPRANKFFLFRVHSF